MESYGGGRFLVGEVPRRALGRAWDLCGVKLDPDAT